MSEAEDIVQEGLLRLHRALEDGQELEPRRGRTCRRWSRAWRSTQLRSARVRRETYVGEWLPEPLLTTGEDEPARHAETADSLSLAFLVRAGDA